MCGGKEKLRRALLGVLLLLGACDFLSRESPSKPPQRPGTIRVGLAGIEGPASIDPARAGGATLALLSNACWSLTRLDEKGKAVGGLAQVGMAQGDPKKFKVGIRPGLRFSGGGAVDARAVVASLVRLASPATASPWAPLLSSIQGFDELANGVAEGMSGIEVTGDLALQITLDEPFADFDEVLAHPGLAITATTPAPTFAPPTSSPAIPSPGGPEVARPPSCAGPYSIQPGAGERDWDLVRDAKFFTQVVGSTGARVVVRGFESEDEAFDALKRGEVDAAPVPLRRVQEARGQRGHVFRRTTQVDFVMFDHAKPETSSPKLRQAISLALDRLPIIDAAFGDDRQAATRWLIDVPTTSIDEGCAKYAKKVADKAAAARAFSESAVAATTTFPFYFDRERIDRLVAQAISVQVRDALGLVLDPKPLDPPAFEAAIRERPAAAVWLHSATALAPFPREFLAPFKSGSPSNLTGFLDEKAERAFLSARGEPETQKRSELYVQAEEAICESMPSIPLWSGVRHWLYEPSKLRFDGSELDAWAELNLVNAESRSPLGGESPLQ